MNILYGIMNCSDCDNQSNCDNVEKCFKNNNFVIEIGSNGFSGFYESIFCNSDEFLDDESELESAIKDSIGNSNVTVEYVYDDDDFSKYKLDVCNAYMEVFIDKIKDVLPSRIVDDDKFLFEIIDKSVVVSSPQYYNFTTDKCYCDVKTNYKTLELIKNHTLKLKGVKEYLRDNFTSCDGFISFVSNSIEYWEELSIEEYIYEERYIIALLDMLVYLSDDDVFYKLNYDVYDSASKYEYAYPKITIDDKEYKGYSDIEKEYGISIWE